MDWLVTLGDMGLDTLIWLAVLAVSLGLVGLLWPCNRGMYWWKRPRAAATDVLYWFVTPVLLRWGGVAALTGAFSASLSAAGRLPLWQQFLAVLVLQDVLLYVIHRLFHSRLAWKFHAVHHSPAVLDWTATRRFHPVNDLLAFSVADAAVLLLGFSPAALLALAPFNTCYSALVHANLNWAFGPLRYVLASPVFHRWHHTLQAEGRDKNFASTFPILDLLLGTFYMPAGKVPEQFGIGDPTFPASFWGQVLYPFRRAAPVPSSLASQHSEAA